MNSCRQLILINSGINQHDGDICPSPGRAANMESSFFAEVHLSKENSCKQEAPNLRPPLESCARPPGATLLPLEVIQTSLLSPNRHFWTVSV